MNAKIVGEIEGVVSLGIDLESSTFRVSKCLFGLVPDMDTAIGAVKAIARGPAFLVTEAVALTEVWLDIHGPITPYKAF
jgi:hypothetical protein